MLKKIITSVNMTIVTILLVPFYVLIIGLAFLMHFLAGKKETSEKTFWKPFQVTGDVSSPY